MANSGQFGQLVPWYISSDDHADFEAFSDTEMPDISEPLAETPAMTVDIPTMPPPTN